MRVHYHRQRGGGVRVVSVGTCRADLWLAVQGGHLDPDRAGRMDHHLFRIGYLYLVEVVEHRQCQLLRLRQRRRGRHCDDLKTDGPRRPVYPSEE
jgi:hypothetical protein